MIVKIKSVLLLLLSLIAIVASIVISSTLVGIMIIVLKGDNQVLTKEGKFFCRSILPMASYSPCIYMSSCLLGEEHGCQDL